MDFIIYHGKKEVKRFEGVESDFYLLKWFLNNQSHSMNWALKYEGYYIEMLEDGKKYKSVVNKYSFDWVEIKQ
jgi:hypothetical protein